MLPHLKNSINQTHLEKGTYEKIVSQIEMGLQLNQVEAPDELRVKFVTQQATKENPEKPK